MNDPFDREASAARMRGQERFWMLANFVVGFAMGSLIVIVARLVR